MSYDYDYEDSNAKVLSAAGVPAEGLGRRVRAVWIEWAKRQPDPKPGWLTPYEFLLPAYRQVDDEIGAGLFSAGWHARARVAEGHGRQPQPEPQQLARMAGDELTAALARAILQLADDAGMPDPYWQDDGRIGLACRILGVPDDGRIGLACRILGVPDDGRVSHAHLWARPR